ncbi:MAG: EAL domain-containing protein [Candidatus Thiodiazotropha sp.]
MTDKRKTTLNDAKQQFMRDKAEEIARSREITEYEKKLADRDKLLQELHVHQVELELQNEELRQAQVKLQYTHQQYLDLYNEAPMGYASLDDGGIIIRTNQMLATMLGVEKYKLTGRALAEFMAPEDQTIFRSRFTAFAKHPENKYIDSKFKCLAGSGNESGFVGRIQGRRLDRNETVESAMRWSETLLVVIGDVTELKKSEERIHFQAHHDVLTGIPNRATLYDQLENSLSLAKRQDSYGALLFMDLDRFKTVNDSLGHHAGDQLLVGFTRRMRKHIRKEDMLARMGGDEFVILLAEHHHNNHVMAVNAQRFAEHIMESLSEPLIVDKQPFQISLSIGISVFPFHDEDNVNDVVRQADTAMYQAKSDGRGLVRFFHSSMQESARQRMTMEAELRVAMIEEQFMLYYQPQLTMEGEIHAVEVLVRWKHPYRGVVSPDKFISVAEESGMIITIGEWVIENAIKQIVEWQKDEIVTKDLRFSINISARQLEVTSFCERIEAIIDRYELNPECLVFEITESLLIPNDRIADVTLARLSKIGLTFSVDDFGTGFSSLAVIQNKPIGQLKIDKRFIMGLKQREEINDDVTQSKQHAMVKAILSMASALGLEVVAEGVETEEQKLVLDDLGCRYMQGYYFTKPMPAPELVSYIGDYGISGNRNI